MEPENLTKEFSVSESVQVIFDSIHCKCGHYTYVYHMSTLIQSWCGGKYYKNKGNLLGGLSDCMNNTFWTIKSFSYYFLNHGII